MNPSQTHFHIRWSGGLLDWEAFNTRAEAEEAACQLAHPHESCSVEARNDACERCATFRREKMRGLSSTTHIPKIGLKTLCSPPRENA